MKLPTTKPGILKLVLSKKDSSVSLMISLPHDFYVICNWMQDIYRLYPELFKVEKSLYESHLVLVTAKAVSFFETYDCRFNTPDDFFEYIDSRLRF